MSIAMFVVPRSLKMASCPVLLTATSTRFAITCPATGLRLDVAGLAPLAGNSFRNVDCVGAIAVTLTTTALTPLVGTPLPVTPTVIARVADGPSGPWAPEPLVHRFALLAR